MANGINDGTRRRCPRSNGSAEMQSIGLQILLWELRLREEELEDGRQLYVDREAQGDALVACLGAARGFTWPVRHGKRVSEYQTTRDYLFTLHLYTCTYITLLSSLSTSCLHLWPLHCRHVSSHLSGRCFSLLVYVVFTAASQPWPLSPLK